MKKILLISVFSFIFTISGYSKQRTESEALNVAHSFYEKSSKLKTGASLTLAYAGKEVSDTRSAGNNAHYYIFNNGSEGFVVVSGDDRAKEILGYSDEGSFDYAAAPDNFKYWLNCYKEEIKYLLSQPESSVEQTAELNGKTTKSAEAFTAVIQPLLGAIKWDQDTPYNDLCPTTSVANGSKKTATGCVATGMAQVMKYYNWPDAGVGSNTYTPSAVGKSITVNFAQTTYDWANMTPTYSSSSSDAQKTAVATLMYHCGVAVDMNYDSSDKGGSGASSKNMGAGMVKYFKYDTGMQLYSREYYSRNEWTNMLKTELNASRPVLYNGQSTDVGHLFVCDGYDSNSLFHMNWGWSGSSNGYFELSALNPSSLGIGGGNAGGFNFGQGITTGIQKPTASPVKTYNIYGDYYDKPANTTRNASFNLILNNVVNLGITTAAGLQSRMELRNASGALAATLKLINFGDLPAGYGTAKLGDTFTATIPSGVSPGRYKLYYTFKTSDQTDYWAPRLKNGTPQYVEVEVTSTQLIFSLPTENMPSLTLNSLAVKGSLYSGKTGRFTVSVSNTGTGDYNSYLSILLQSKTNTSIKGLILQDPVVIAAGETKTFELKGAIDATKFTAGSYSLGVMYDPQNNLENAETVYSLGTSQTVNVLAAPTQAPALGIVGTPAFKNPASIYRDNVELNAQIRNTGGYYDGRLMVLIYTDPYDGGYNLTSFGDYAAYIDNNETANVTFNGAINLEQGSYNAVIFYDNGGLKQLSNMIKFTLLGNSSDALSPAEAVEAALYPNPADDAVYLKSASVVKAIRIFDLSGKQVLAVQPNASGEITVPVAGLPQGTYILRSVTDEGITNYKFIKQ